MLGLGASSICSSGMEFWAQLTRGSGFQRSPQALHNQWLRMRDVAGAVPTKTCWTPEEDSRLCEAMRGLDASLIHSSSIEFWAQLAR